MRHEMVRVCLARKLSTPILTLALIACAGVTYAQTDPGPRGGSANAGRSLANLTTTQQAFFNSAAEVFAEVDSVKGAGCSAGQTVNSVGIPCTEAGVGLGPTFNGNSCAQCHAEPAMGGSSPGLSSRLHSVPNPQVALAKLDGATNSVPSFITPNGPVREARFVVTDPTNANAPLDGGVHALYTITGRGDAVGCNLGQPDFANNLLQNNVIFRIPTPLFGLGLIEATPDSTLDANLAANASQKSALGITGRLAHSGNDGTVTKFGWKAQNKSLLVFAGEAYNVEQGVSNELFSNERSAVPGCVFNSNPEDKSDLVDVPASASAAASDTVNFAMFMRLLAPPTPSGASASIRNGSALFDSVGCALCHTRTLTSGPSPIASLNRVTYHPFSDFALHSLGTDNGDGIIQGDARTDEFRTAPLWGVGQRLFFFHDGRFSDLNAAIIGHDDTDGDCSSIVTAYTFQVNDTKLYQPVFQVQTCDSEAAKVVANFRALSTNQKQDLLNFLRSL